MGGVGWIGLDWVELKNATADLSIFSFLINRSPNKESNAIQKKKGEEKRETQD